MAGTKQWPRGSMKAVALTKPDAVNLLEKEIPPPAPNTTLVAVSRIGLCGTDLELYEGHSSYLRNNLTHYPLVPGHEWVGRVVADESTGRFHPGDRVIGKTMLTCGICDACDTGRENECVNLREVGLYRQDGAAAEFIRVPTGSLVPVPDTVTDEQAALVEPAVTVLEGLTKARISPGSAVAIFGTGTLGLITIKVLRGYPINLSVFGVQASGLAVAEELGVKRAAVYKEETDNEKFDVAIEVSGSVGGFTNALASLRAGGRLIHIGVAHQGLDNFNIGELALSGKAILGVRHGVYRYREALRLAEMGILDDSYILNRDFDLSDARAAFSTLANPERGNPKVTLVPQSKVEV